MEQEAANTLSMVLLLLLALAASGIVLAYRFKPKRKKSPTMVVHPVTPGTSTPVATAAAPAGAAASGSKASGTVTVIREAFLLGGVSLSTIVKWVLRIVAILVVTAIVVSWIFGFEMPWHRVPRPTSSSDWFMILGLLVLAAIFIPKGKGQTTARITLAIVLLAFIGFGFAPFLNWLGGTLDRGINHGDWSAPADYVEKIYGGSLRVGPGQTRTVDISGKIRVPIPVHHCLDISPRNSFFITWDGSISNAYIEPKSGRMERVTVTALDAYQCQQQRL